jgi:hypothetical protein
MSSPCQDPAHGEAPEGDSDSRSDPESRAECPAVGLPESARDRHLEAVMGEKGCQECGRQEDDARGEEGEM